MSKNLADLLPLASRIVREEDPSSLLRFVRTGAAHPRSKATWAHYFRQKGSRLVLTLDMSAQATKLRNEIKSQYLHRWGYFPDTQFVMIDPLPDREVYMPLYKGVIDHFCAHLPPTMPVGPTKNVYVCKGRIPSGLVQGVTFLKGKAPPKETSRGHRLISMSLPVGSILHKLRDYFLTEFEKIDNEEMQTYIMEIRNMKFKAQMPLGYANQMGVEAASLVRLKIISSLNGTTGLDLGNASGLSLCRHHYDQYMDLGWDEPVIAHRDCVYSRVFEAARTPEFISIAPNEQANEDVAMESVY